MVTAWGSGAALGRASLCAGGEGCIPCGKGGLWLGVTLGVVGVWWRCVSDDVGLPKRREGERMIVVMDLWWGVGPAVLGESLEGLGE